MIRRRFGLYYVIELLYGARKQIFLTFAPFVLIRHYDFSASDIALLIALCGLLTTVTSPMIGRLIDRLGYRTVMVLDTAFLTVVCLAFGGAGTLFSPKGAVAVLYVSFLLDAALTTASSANHLYAKALAADRDELTTTLATGLSVNHFFAPAVLLFGGWLWSRRGYESLFLIAAAVSAVKSVLALASPRNPPEIHCRSAEDFG